MNRKRQLRNILARRLLKCYREHREALKEPELELDNWFAMHNAAETQGALREIRSLILFLRMDGVI